MKEDDEEDSPHPHSATKWTEIWDENRRLRDKLHALSNEVTILKERVEVLREIENQRFTKMATIMGIVITLSTTAVQLIFKAFSK